MTHHALPVDYSAPFWIDEPVGNNAFAYEQRGPSPRIWVPSLVTGSWEDVRPGTEIVFADVDEHGVLHACSGLAHLVHTSWEDTHTIVVDNHNHAFYFWYEALLAGRLERGATLVHLDQHRDTRIPSQAFRLDSSLEEAFRYTNYQLNVGNYIEPARATGLINDVLFVTGSAGLDDRSRCRRNNLILNIDLDFFAPEMDYIDFDRTRAFVDAHRTSATIVTIATSPFFIGQQRAISSLARLVGPR